MLLVLMAIALNAFMGTILLKVFVWTFQDVWLQPLYLTEHKFVLHVRYNSTLFMTSKLKSVSVTKDLSKIFSSVNLCRACPFVEMGKFQLNMKSVTIKMFNQEMVATPTAQFKKISYAQLIIPANAPYIWTLISWLLISLLVFWDKTKESFLFLLSRNMLLCRNLTGKSWWSSALQNLLSILQL